MIQTSIPKPLRSLWRLLRRSEPILDLHPFEGSYTAWRRLHVELTGDRAAKVKEWQKKLQGRLSFRIVTRSAPCPDKLVRSLEKQLLPPAWPISQQCDQGTEKNSWVVLIPPECELLPDALLAFSWWIQEHPQAAVLYADEELCHTPGGELEPFFKPDWSPDLHDCVDYLGMVAIKHERIAPHLSGEMTVDLSFLKALAEVKGSDIVHIPWVLSRRPQTAASLDAGEHEERIRRLAEFRGQPLDDMRRGSQHALWVDHVLPDPAPDVSIIIPSRDRRDLLKQCLDSLLEKTTYPSFEVHLIDNDSRDPATLRWFEEAASINGVSVHSWPHPFNFAAINNFGARQCRGEILLFLNDDTSILDGEWLTHMVRHAIRPPVGAVGALLYYPDDTIQHAGVVLGLSRAHIAGHLYRGVAGDSTARPAEQDCVQNYSVVTGACLMVRRSVFDAVGGFDERFKVCYNDVDLCLRIREHGWRNLWTPQAVLYHHENVSVAPRTEAQARVYQREARLMRKRWRRKLLCDPAYNPNLALGVESRLLARAPRMKRPW